MFTDLQTILYIAFDKAINTLYQISVDPAIPSEPFESIDPTNAFDAFIVLTQVCGC